MKTMTARDAKNHFGEFLDTARREPVVITKNDRPVGIMISIEDAREMLLDELLLDKDPGYDNWLAEKLSTTQHRLAAGATGLHDHEDALQRVKERLAARLGKAA